jgi:hypothetical protein
MDAITDECKQRKNKKQEEHHLCPLIACNFTRDVRRSHS